MFFLRSSLACCSASQCYQVYASPLPRLEPLPSAAHTTAFVFSFLFLKSKNFKNFQKQNKTKKKKTRQDKTITKQKEANDERYDV